MVLRVHVCVQGEGGRAVLDESGAVTVTTLCPKSTIPRTLWAALLCPPLHLVPSISAATLGVLLWPAPSNEARPQGLRRDPCNAGTCPPWKDTWTGVHPRDRGPSLVLTQVGDLGPALCIWT